MQSKHSKHSLKARLLAVTGGAIVVALAAGGVAMATTPSSTPSAQTSATTVASASSAVLGGASVSRGQLRDDVIWLMRHTVHAGLIVDTSQGYKVLDIDKGALRSDSPTSVTIVRPDGPIVTARVSSSTKFPGLPESQLKPGDAVVLAQGSGGNALVVWARPATASSAGS
ncbi:MAG TPA: hypothetical protein VKA05_09330 [Acidimicrobiales bacterium]|nr:hypothetical protein [Acidimicrobiales bacterium]